MSTTLTKELLNKYKTDIFIESGTYIGEGIDQALLAGYKSIYSIELHTQLYENVVEKYKFAWNVCLFNADSSKILLPLLNNNVGNRRCTIWLDGHYSGDHTALGDKVCPLIEELEQIKQHSIKNHYILIDDIRYIRGGEYGITLEELINKIKEINPDYQITFTNGYEVNDILIASL